MSGNKQNLFDTMQCFVTLKLVFKKVRIKKRTVKENIAIFLKAALSTSH